MSDQYIPILGISEFSLDLIFHFLCFLSDECLKINSSREVIRQTWHGDIFSQLRDPLARRNYLVGAVWLPAEFLNLVYTRNMYRQVLNRFPNLFDASFVEISSSVIPLA